MLTTGVVMRRRATSGEDGTRGLVSGLTFHRQGVADGSAGVSQLGFGVLNPRAGSSGFGGHRRATPPRPRPRPACRPYRGSRAICGRFPRAPPQCPYPDGPIRNICRRLVWRASTPPADDAPEESPPGNPNRCAFPSPPWRRSRTARPGAPAPPRRCAAQSRGFAPTTPRPELSPLPSCANYKASGRESKRLDAGALGWGNRAFPPPAA